MIQKQIVQLTEAAKQLELHITIETAGTVIHPVECDLMSISPKLSNSTPEIGRAGEWVERHERTRKSKEVVDQLLNHYNYQLKFVVDTREDLDEINEYLDSLTAPYEKSRVLMMPQGVTQEELAVRQQWLEPYCIENDYTFSPRMHIQWYGNKRGT